MYTISISTLGKRRDLVGVDVEAQELQTRSPYKRTWRTMVEGAIQRTNGQIQWAYCIHEEKDVEGHLDAHNGIGFSGRRIPSLAL